MAGGYRFLEHSSDVYVEAWGESLEEAFENAGRAMFDAMTDISKVKPTIAVEVEAEGGDEEEPLTDGEGISVAGTRRFAVGKPLPGGRWHQPLGLAQQFHSGRLPKAEQPGIMGNAFHPQPLEAGLLEPTADLVKEDVARVGDSSHHI